MKPAKHGIVLMDSEGVPGDGDKIPSGPDAAMASSVIVVGGCQDWMIGTTLYHASKTKVLYVDYSVASFGGDCAANWLFTKHLNGVSHWHYCP